MARREFQRSMAAALLLTRRFRGLVARARLAAAHRAATRLQGRTRGKAARRHAAERWRGLAVLQRWLSSNHFRLLVRNLFAAARCPPPRGLAPTTRRSRLPRGPHPKCGSLTVAVVARRRDDAAFVTAVLEARPELRLVRSMEASRPTLLHAASAAGAVTVLQQLCSAIAALLLERPVPAAQLQPKRDPNRTPTGLQPDSNRTPTRAEFRRRSNQSENKAKRAASASHSASAPHPCARLDPPLAGPVAGSGARLRQGVLTA